MVAVHRYSLCAEFETPPSISASLRETSSPDFLRQSGRSLCREARLRTRQPLVEPMLPIGKSGALRSNRTEARCRLLRRGRAPISQSKARLPSVGPYAAAPSHLPRSRPSLVERVPPCPKHLHSIGTTPDLRDQDAKCKRSPWGLRSTKGEGNWHWVSD